ncbi:hypothetical protein Dsin_023364 [Dipteronia sinensis]|uniref:DUF4283 domain-containing protein n=1 Tax=Dipteronia sinensis TaxID=43782 RepID=A0AAE0A4B3_9ROSI|nr:hypothetical protein Dsin_023364 [Dipteronia sinensis]
MRERVERETLSKTKMQRVGILGKESQKENFINSRSLREDCFSVMVRWSESSVPQSRLVRVSCWGIPLTCWTQAFFNKLGCLIGEPVLIEKETLLRDRLDKEKMMILVPQSTNCSCKVKVSGNHRTFVVNVDEERNLVDVQWLESFLGLRKTQEEGFRTARSEKEEFQICVPRTVGEVSKKGQDVVDSRHERRDNVLSSRPKGKGIVKPKKVSFKQPLMESFGSRVQCEKERIALCVDLGHIEVHLAVKEMSTKESIFGSSLKRIIEESKASSANLSNQAVFNSGEMVLSSSDEELVQDSLEVERNTVYIASNCVEDIFCNFENPGFVSEEELEPEKRVIECNKAKAVGDSEEKMVRATESLGWAMRS